MNYDEAVAYIADIPKFTGKNPNTHTREILRRLGCEGREQKIIHVAGTNGKGSVCAYAQAILLAEKRTVGLFISPHLVKVNERICINGQMIGDTEFLDSFLKVKAVAEQMQQEGLAHPSYFEFLFCMAMLSFTEAEVEFIILETGIGGRLDTTNVIESPLVTVITSIGFDHTDILGNTIEEIALEKAGIIKEGIPVYCDASNPISTDVIRNRAALLHAPCREISNNAYEIQEIGRKHIAFSCANAYYEDITWELSNLGYYQVMNACLALEAMQEVFKGEEVHLHAWKQALEEVHWEGRMEEVLPGVILDGAHNMKALEAFVKSVDMQNQPESERQVVLFSAVQEKDYEQMIAYLCSHMQADVYVITEIEDKRKVQAGELADICRRYTDCDVVVREDLTAALVHALHEKGDDGRLYCLGSLYLVGMIKKILQEG